jgi:sterol desaturase/sphingolipid hydroxylase (fatty acid hydroxylase superfamily)
MCAAASRFNAGHDGAITSEQATLFVTVTLTLLWMFWGEPRTYFYGFFAAGSGHEFNFAWAVLSVVAYVFWFDTWFYWSHRWLHDIDWLWHHVHFVHHQFKEPSAWAQFAVHPVEAALQGPVGHFLCAIFFPMHPVLHAVLGFLSSAWAIAAHDGRALDLNSHYFHHSKGRGRHVYFNLGFVTPFWDQICGTRWSEDHPSWVEWKTSKALFDTRDGTAKGVTNDVFQCYDAVSGIKNAQEAFKGKGKRA